MFTTNTLLASAYRIHVPTTVLSSCCCKRRYRLGWDCIKLLFEHTSAEARVPKHTLTKAHQKRSKNGLKMSSEKAADNVFQWSEDGKPVKVDKWNGTTVKNALDDAVRMIMTKHFHYEENHKLMDQRLFICTVSCLFAVTALIYDFLRPFPESRLVLLICVLSYFILMGVLTLYTTYVEKNHFLVVHQKDPAGIDPDKVWTVDSCMKRFDDMYTLCLMFEDKQNSISHEATLTKSVGSWFDENGELIGDNFLKDVCSLHAGVLTEKKTK